MKTKYQFFIIAVVALILSACAEPAKISTSGTTDSSSRVEDASATNTTAVATCNKFEANFMSAKMKVYVDGAGQPRYQYIRMNINTLGSKFMEEGATIAFYRWQASGSADGSLDETPLKFRLELASSYASAYAYNNGNLTGYMSTLSYDDLVDKADDAGLEVDDYIQKVNLVIDTRDASGDYQVIKAVLYDASSTSTDESDSLLPPFKANPLTYAETQDNFGQTRSSLLVQMHPFYGYKDQTQAYFQSLANQFCF